MEFILEDTWWTEDTHELVKTQITAISLVASIDKSSPHSTLPFDISTQGNLHFGNPLL